MQLHTLLTSLWPLNGYLCYIKFSITITLINTVRFDEINSLFNFRNLSLMQHISCFSDNSCMNSNAVYLSGWLQGVSKVWYHLQRHEDHLSRWRLWKVHQWGHRLQRPICQGHLHSEYDKMYSLISFLNLFAHFESMLIYDPIYDAKYHKILPVKIFLHNCIQKIVCKYVNFKQEYVAWL